jgi:hypothetical protein
MEISYPETPEADYDSEIFIWDGAETFNLSQNPGGRDTDPVWSDDGHLAFESRRDGRETIVVWNGKTIPVERYDTKAFSIIIPTIDRSYFNPRWTSTGMLLFDEYDKITEREEVLSWDGKQVTSTSLNPNRDYAGFNPEGTEYWAYFDCDICFNDFYIYDQNDQIVYHAERASTAGWNDSGYLVFCEIGDNGWQLMLWDGSGVSEIFANGDIYASWKKGERAICTYG